MSVMKDTFNNINDFNNNWIVSSINGASISIKNNKVIMESGNTWSGQYIQYRDKLYPGFISVEFDYNNLECHYTTADKPYIALIGNDKEYNRDDRYNMIDDDTNKSLIIYLNDNLDSYTRSIISMYYGKKKIMEKSVSYSMTEQIHIKLIFVYGHIRFYINDKKILEYKLTEYKEIGKHYLFEVNNNSYGQFTTIISNMSITNYLQSYKIKCGDFIYNVNGSKLTTTNINENGFDDISNMVLILNELIDKNYTLIKIRRE